MASQLTTAGKNAVLDSDTTWPPAYLAAHTVDAPTDGTSEVTGGSPAYARKAASWDASADGTKALTGTYTFDIPGGTTVKSIGLWSESSGGTLLGSFDVADKTDASQWEYVLTAGSVSIS